MTQTEFKNWTEQNKVSLKDLFPTLQFSEIAVPNMGVNSTFFGNDPEHENLEKAALRLEEFQEKHPKAILANGYLEQRSFYNTLNYERYINNVKEFRNIHLGTDFWVPKETPLHAIFDSKVVICEDNNTHKDYGGLVVLEHCLETITFWTLYGHLSKVSLAISPVGTEYKKGELFAYIGNENENGHWVPHLHFQLITDLLGNTNNYNGVAFPSEIEIWKERCPNPDFIFIEHLPSAEISAD